MRGAVVACDLCELWPDLAWIIRTDRFTLMVEPDVVIADFKQDEEWGLCNQCKLDVMTDDQNAIMARRRLAHERDTPDFWSQSNAERGLAYQVLDMIVMTVLSSRQKAWGRAWTPQDTRQAQATVKRDGRRGKRP